MPAELEKTKTPGVYKRGDRYVVIWRHRGKQHKQFFRTYAEAREAKGQRTAGVSAPATRRSFEDYARDWVKTAQGRTARGLDADTRSGYERALELYAIPRLGTMLLREIDRGDVDGLVARMQKRGLRPASITKYIAPVRALFADAVERGDVTVNPATHVRVNPKAPRPESDKPERVKHMTRRELAAVLNAIPETSNGGRDRLLFELLAHTGCRISEALGLDWSDLGHDGATLRIERQWYRGNLKRYTKTANGQRTISLPSGLARRLWQRGADASGPMFQTRTGERLSDRNVRRTLDAAVRTVSGPRISPHSLRHTHGSILLDQGWPITDVAHRLGDDVQTIARTYAHKLRDSDRSLDFLEELGAPGSARGPTERSGAARS